MTEAAATKRGSGRGPGRPSNADRRESLAGTIENGLAGLATLLERRDELAEADTFAAVLRRDKAEMAEWLAAVAEQYATAERVVKWLFGAGSLIGFAGAFGPLVAHTIDRIRLSGLLDFGGTEPDLPPPPAP